MALPITSAAITATKTAAHPSGSVALGPPKQLQDGQGDDALREPQREVHDQLDPRLTRVQQECGSLTQQARGDQHPRVHEEQPDHQRHLAEQEAVGLVAELEVEHQETAHGEHRRQQQQGDMRRSGRPRVRLEERDEGTLDSRTLANATVRTVALAAAAGPAVTTTCVGRNGHGP